MADENWRSNTMISTNQSTVSRWTSINESAQLYNCLLTHPGKIHSDRLHLTGAATFVHLGETPSVCCEDTGGGLMQPESKTISWRVFKGGIKTILRLVVIHLYQLFDDDAVIIINKTIELKTSKATR